MCIGDQVLEYNGIVLTGKTFEEVQRITSQPNGEIELVIKAYVLPLTTHVDLFRFSFIYAGFVLTIVLQWYFLKRTLQWGGVEKHHNHTESNIIYVPTQ